MIDPDQGIVNPDPNTAWGVLQRLENALKQTTCAIAASLGSLAGFYPSLVSCLGEVQRVGGHLLATRCDRKLLHWQKLVFRLEKAVDSELRNDVWRLMMETRIRIMREREARAKRILEQEAIAANLRERQHRLQREIGSHTSDAVLTGALPIQGRPTLEDLNRESTDVHRALSEATQLLHVLQREEEASVAALSEGRLEQEAEAQVKADRAKELATVKAELESFTVLDCVD